MSRTYRRTKPGDVQEHDWAIQDVKKYKVRKVGRFIHADYSSFPTKWTHYLKEYNYEWWEFYYLTGEEKKKALNKFQRDRPTTMNQVPSWWKREYCRKPYRRKERVTLQKAVKYPEEDVVFPKLVKDSRRYW